MSTKQVAVEGLGTVTLYKRKQARSLRLSITSGNKIRVTMPSWAPYASAVDFVLSKRDWILAQQPRSSLLSEGTLIGKAHRLRYVRSTGQRASSRIRGTELFVALPADMAWSDDRAQESAHSGAIKVLKSEAEQLLPQRLEALAQRHGFTYQSVSIKQLKGRWGSCNSHTDIVLNCFLMRLPWPLIDYVLIHELVHTRIMAHGRPFWTEVARYVSDLASIRKQMKLYQPTL